MKRWQWLLLAAVGSFGSISVFGADPLEKPILSEGEVQQPAQPKTLDVVVTDSSRDRPKKKFSSDTPKIRAFWRGRHLEGGDRIQVLWLAEDVGVDAPKDSKITEGAVTAYKPDDNGIFALERPKEGWPIGRYRVELYLNGRLMQTEEFDIFKGATIDLGQ